jgi:hypothetical protein
MRLNLLHLDRNIREEADTFADTLIDQADDIEEISKLLGGQRVDYKPDPDAKTVINDILGALTDIANSTDNIATDLPTLQQTAQVLLQLSKDANEANLPIEVSRYLGDFGNRLEEIRKEVELGGDADTAAKRVFRDFEEPDWDDITPLEQLGDGEEELQIGEDDTIGGDIMSPPLPGVIKRRPALGYSERVS